MRIIFLDVDGVLNNNETADRICGFVGIDPILVERLQRLYKESNEQEPTRIVVSSSWRMDIIRKVERIDNCYNVFVDRLLKAGIEVLDITPDINGWSRGKEIVKWLDENKVNRDVITYVVIDDEVFDFESVGIASKCIITNSIYGLTDKDIDNALKILNGEEINE